MVCEESNQKNQTQYQEAEEKGKIHINFHLCFAYLHFYNDGHCAYSYHH